MKNPFLLIVILFCFYVSSQAQINESKSSKENIDGAIESSIEWLKNVDSSNYNMSWETSSELFKKAVTKDNWVKTLMGLRPSLGKVISREIKTKKYETSLPGAPDGEYVVIVYSTIFENKENSFETVTPMKDIDGEWRVSGYYIK
jgi:Protein of unknown function (DUF4019)